jgi:hypothetical protein
MRIGKLATRQILLAAGLGLALGGCSIMHAQSRIDPRTVASYEPRGATPAAGAAANTDCYTARYDGDANAGVVDLTCARFPGDDDGPTAYALATGATLYDPAHMPLQGEPLETARRQFRNRLGAMLMKHSDDVCTASIGRAANNEAVSNAVLNTLTTTLASVASIVTGQEAQRILGAGAAISSGTRDHLNAAIFRNVLVSAVSRAIRDERTGISRSIDEGMTKPITDYNADTMIRDINRYHQSCSFIRGLELVVRAVDRTATSDRTEQIQRYNDAITALDGEIGKVIPPATAPPQLVTLRNDLIAARSRLLVSNDLPVSPSTGSSTGNVNGVAAGANSGSNTNSGGAAAGAGTGSKPGGNN